MPSQTQKHGWSAVSENIKIHDEGMVKDYADDVDTLLVFVSRNGCPSSLDLSFTFESS